MKNPNEFVAEFEALLIKYEVAKCVSIFPMEELTRTIVHATNKEEEVEILYKILTKKDIFLK